MQVFNFGLPAQFEVPYRRDDLHIRDQGIENHIKPYLVISGAGATMSDVFRTDFLGIVGNCSCLAYPFSAYRKRVCGILKYIAKNEVFDTAFVITLCFVDHRM